MKRLSIFLIIVLIFITGCVTSSSKKNEAPILQSLRINDFATSMVLTNTISSITLNITDKENDQISTVVITSESGKITQKSLLEYEYRSPVVNGTENLTITITDKSGSVSKVVRSLEVVKDLAQKEITFLVYMAAANNLNGYSLKDDYSYMDLDEIKKAKNVDTNKVAVVILGDFMKANSTYSGISVKNGDRLDIKSTEGNFNTGDKDNLTRLLNYGAEKYPAKKYILVFWGHGTGWTDDIYKNGNNPTQAISLDDNSNGDSLDLWEVEAGIKSSKIPKVDIIYTDVCLMGGIETAVQLQDVADVAVWSPQLTPGKGGYYTGILEYLGQHYTDSSLEIGKNIEKVNAESYKSGGAQVSGNDIENYVYSVFDLNKVKSENLFLKLDKVAELLKYNVSLLKEDVVINGLRCYGIDSDYFNDYVDLGDLFTRIKKSPNASANLKSAITDFMTSYEATRYYLVCQNGKYSFGTVSEEGATGMSIFLPIVDSVSSIEEYKDATRFGRTSKWVDVITEYKVKGN